MEIQHEPVTMLEAVKNSIRFERRRALAESDWTQAADSPLSDENKQKWKEYRQALRDAPSKYENNPIEENTYLPDPPF
jgi:uncharacterized membrane protein